MEIRASRMIAIGMIAIGKLGGHRGIWSAVQMCGNRGQAPVSPGPPSAPPCSSVLMRLINGGGHPTTRVWALHITSAIEQGNGGIEIRHAAVTVADYHNLALSVSGGGRRCR